MLKVTDELVAGCTAVERPCSSGVPEVLHLSLGSLGWCDKARMTWLMWSRVATRQLFYWTCVSWRCVKSGAAVKPKAAYQIHLAAIS